MKSSISESLEELPESHDGLRKSQGFTTEFSQNRHLLNVSKDWGLEIRKGQSLVTNFYVAAYETKVIIFKSLITWLWIHHAKYKSSSGA